MFCSISSVIDLSSVAPQIPTEFAYSIDPVGRSAPRAAGERRRSAWLLCASFAVTVCKFCGYRVQFCGYRVHYLFFETVLGDFCRACFAAALVKRGATFRSERVRPDRERPKP